MLINFKPNQYNQFKIDAFGHAINGVLGQLILKTDN